MDSPVWAGTPAFDIRPDHLAELADLPTKFERFGELLVLWLGGVETLRDELPLGLVVHGGFLRFAVDARLEPGPFDEGLHLLGGGGKKGLQLCPALDVDDDFRIVDVKRWGDHDIGQREHVDQREVDETVLFDASKITHLQPEFAFDQPSTILRDLLIPLLLLDRLQLLRDALLEFLLPL